MTEVSIESGVLDADVSAEILGEIVKETFTVMVGEELFESFEEPPLNAVGPTSMVHITGERPITVQLVFDPALAERSTAAMFQMPVEELDEASIADALGELANMIGGSVKATLPPPCQLSLPSVTVGTQTTQIPGAFRASSLGFTNGVDTIVVNLWQSLADHHPTDG